MPRFVPFLAARSQGSFPSGTEIDWSGRTLKLSPIGRDTLNQELQLSGTALDDRVDWVGGAFLFREKEKSVFLFNILSEATGFSRGNEGFGNRPFGPDRLAWERGARERLSHH